MLRQTIPPNGRPVCSGKQFEYVCFADPPGVSWQENGKGVTLSYAQTGPESRERFEFEVILSNQTTLVTTATLHKAHSNDTGTRIECIDEGIIQTKFVEVAS